MIMVKKRRQFLCLLLAVLMCISLFPISVFAEAETEPAAEEVEMLSEEPAEVEAIAEEPEEVPAVESEEAVPEEETEAEEAQAEDTAPMLAEDVVPAEMELEAAEVTAEPAATPESWEIEVEEGMFHGYDASFAVEQGLFFSPDGVYNLDYPVLEEFILEEDSVTVAAGDTVHFKVKFSDVNGINSAYLNFGLASSGSRYISLKENSETGYYEGSYKFTDTNIPGEYFVTSCNATDKYGFYTYYSSSSQRVMQRFCPGSVFLPGDNEQSETPTSDVANFEFKENGQTLRPGDKLHVSFDIPAGFDANYINVNFYRSAGSIDMSWSKWDDEEEENTLSYDSATGHVSGEYTLTAELKNGRCSSIYVYAYNNDDNISGDFYNDYGFNFTGGVETAKATITDVTCEENGQTLTDGDTVHVSFRVNTSEKVNSARISFQNFETGNYTYGSGVSHSKNSFSANAELDEATGLYKAAYTFKENDVYGVYKVRVSASTSGSSVSCDTDIMISFAENKSETFTRCDPATNLNWTDDFYIRFTLPADHTGRYSVNVYNAADPSSTVAGITYNGGSGDHSWTATRGIDAFLVNHNSSELETGYYYFTVTVLGDGVNNYDSVIAKSPNKHFEAPSKKLGFATNLTWEGTQGEENKHGKFTIPADNEYVGGYEYTFYYSKTENGPKVNCNMYGRGGSGNWDKKTGTAYIFDSVLQTYGAGYYYFKIRLLSSNITQCQNGTFCELSGAYYVGQVSESVITKLEEVKTAGKTPAEIKEQVQDIPTEDLKQAMLTNDSVVSRLRQLETAAGTGTKVSVTDVPVLSTGVRATGAGLNDTIRDGDVTLVIEKPKKDDVLPAMYNNSVAVRFSMDLDNVADTSSLKVPVLIDLPIPADINPSFLVLLHYPADGGEPESIFPTTYLAGDQYYAQFVLTGFSDYILTERINAIFTDVADPAAYYFSAVYWAYKNGVTSGTSATTFSPGKSCTRGQIVTFLWKALGSPEPSSMDNPFTDVKESDYFYKPVLWAKENGVTAGKTPTTFGPGLPCTRGQIVTFLWKALGSPEPSSTNNPFTDVKTGDYFYKPVLWAKEKGITSGTSATTFGPGTPCPRGQSMTFLWISKGRP